MLLAASTVSHDVDVANMWLRGQLGGTERRASMDSNSGDPKYQPGEPPAPPEHAGDMIISPDTRRANRIPPGQSRTRRWPVLHYGHVPSIDLSRWRLQVHGLVEQPLTLTWDEFQVAAPSQGLLRFSLCHSMEPAGKHLGRGVGTRTVATGRCSPRGEVCRPHGLRFRLDDQSAVGGFPGRGRLARRHARWCTDRC